MLGFLVAVLACAGTNCDLVNPEPGVSFPTYEACQAELVAKKSRLAAQLDQLRRGGRAVQALCVREIGTIVEVEEPYDVIDTAIVHAEPGANATFVGIVESGQRTLVTGIVAGSQWVRVTLPDGKSGYVFADHLRRVAAESPPAATVPAAPSATAQAPQVRAPVPPPIAPRTEQATGGTGLPALRRPPETTPAPPTAAAIATVAPRPGAPQQREFRDCEHCPTMVMLPAGEFAMGSNADPSERPIHRVRVPAFAIGKLELSAAEWNACADAGGCEYKQAAQDGAPERRPISNISWDDATQYVKWLAKTTGKPYRLPTEAEWEYAARAGTTTRYAWGNELKPGRADCLGCGPGHDRSHPADLGTFPPNAWGLFDMEGNVAEWVQDCWHDSYRGAPAGAEAWQGADCESRVLRGGSWNNPPADITVSSRNFYDGSVRYPGNGVRVALSVHPGSP